MYDPERTEEASRFALRDVLAGAVFVTIALVFGIEATSYEIGRAIRMGPGFIPLALSLLLAVLGIAIAATGFAKHGSGESSPVPWRGLVLVSAALMIFGVYGRSLGLVPVVFVCVLITALASTRNSVVSAVVTALVLSALCWVVFKVGLEMSLPTIGPVFGRFQVH